MNSFLIIIVALISSIVGGILVALTNYFLFHKKLDAKLESLIVENNKGKNVISRIINQMYYKSVTDNQSCNDSSTDTLQKFLYDGTLGIKGFDFKKEYGNCVFKDGEIWVEGKKDEEGVYEGAALELRNYIYEGKERDYIPRNELMTGSRKFYISFETKIIGIINAVKIGIDLRSIEGHRLDFSSNIIENTEWTKTEWFFKSSKADDCRFTLIIRNSKSPFIIQIRNFIVKELYE